MNVILDLGGTSRRHGIEDPMRLLTTFREDPAYAYYYGYSPRTPLNELWPEDLAVSLVMNSQAQGRTFVGLAEHTPLDLSTYPDKPLAKTSAEDRERLVDLIARVAEWPGVKASMATKVLHKKRPALLPILDNQAIFGAYMDERWPGRPASQDSVKSTIKIGAAIEAIREDLVRRENEAAWQELAHAEPDRTQIEIFDMIWWEFFREQQPR